MEERKRLHAYKPRKRGDCCYFSDHHYLPLKLSKLFKKTDAKTLIHCLPLADEQVDEKNKPAISSGHFNLMPPHNNFRTRPPSSSPQDKCILLRSLQQQTNTVVKILVF
jgi:hypothetical protein